MKGFARLRQAVRGDRSMLFSMPCSSCDFVLMTDEVALLPQLSTRLKEHIRSEHARGQALPGRDAFRS
jgi:hypothetical protein